MAIVSIEEFKAKLNGTSRLLALDVGTKTIGVAFGAILTGTVSPLKVINRKKMAVDAAQLKEYMAQYGCEGLVVGWPLNVDGAEGPRCQGVRDVMLELLKHIPDVPVIFYDERFSTHKAEKFMIEEVDYSRAKRDRIVDKMAAQVILQEFLELEMGISHIDQGGYR